MPDIRAQQDAHFNELYEAFFQYYQAALQKSPQPHAKVRLHLSAEFFDDLELMKIMQPLFAKYATNAAEKRAVARAALYEALDIHHRTARIQWVEVSNKDICKGKGNY